MQPKPIYAIHGASDLDYDGWIVLTRGIGRDPDDRGGENFRIHRQTPVVRLNHGYHPHGTIPRPEHYRDFAQRVAHYVEMSPGCSRWIIGNEPNHSQERPGGQPITPGQYAECYTLCREAIHALEFHAGDQVLLAAIAPWNIETVYPRNEGGDWIRYFEDVQFELGVGGCDGFVLHTYTREQSPAGIASRDRMNPPFEHYHNGFRTYQDWMAAILPRFQGLPCYITEFCVAGLPWRDINAGCIAAAYDEVDWWNTLHPDRPISCLAVYRWEHDQWAIHDKPAVQRDFQVAVARGYTWPHVDPVPPEEEDMMLNPSFEGEWYEQDEMGILVLPEHWRAEYLEGGDPWFRPEIKPNEEFTTDGRYSIRAFPPEHSRGFYAIYQEVNATPGQWYKFSADVRVESKPPGRLAAFVGIQPWGASCFFRHMIWGEETQIQLEWQRVEVYARAFGGSIRVAMGATNDFATRNNTCWWDNARLELWECEGGEMPEPPESGECLYDEDYLLERIAEVVHEAVRYELDHSRIAPDE